MTRIAFTSCIRYEAFPSQPHWQHVLDANPDYLFLLGDQIYMDYGYVGVSDPLWGPRSPARLSLEAFRERMEKKYAQQWAEPHFARLLERMKTRGGVYGIWDDHDFAWNGAVGADVPPEKVKASRRLFNRWMYGSESENDIYRYVDFPLGRAIFLDTRSYNSGPSRDRPVLLGEKQWEFVTDALQHDALYTLICSPIALTRWSLLRGQESWQSYKGDLRRLSRLIANGKDVLFLGGDIHRNAFGAPYARRPCHELIASGFAVNLLGLGKPIRCDDRYNWGLLELSERGAEVTFFRKGEVVSRHKIGGAAAPHSVDAISSGEP
ncbi:alkaline phosphatase D family protein [Aromatoleum diolicum]|uniref:PhoD-like phosphatase metallophosphatase domain-containing protein n=1 Tax=Aromatoleum diolicum TaxID=75796 RepID=A0ABX1QHE3_9RHOO|nr:alkaline phosphatase D family protein [Aromatoleum diolicum]NMG76787.1 hypothetical protein [Aromatoleum diolicum]